MFSTTFFLIVVGVGTFGLGFMMGIRYAENQIKKQIAKIAEELSRKNK